MLKKQTVWLLTMLSLMIVLSVYYILSPGNDELAYVNEGESDEEQEVTSDSNEAGADADVDADDISELGQENLFATIRLDLQDKRSMKKSRLDEIVASSTATTDEKSVALEDIDTLDERSTTESILEDSIVAEADYTDVLVRSKEDKVHVHVQADELSKGEVVNIMQMVKDEFGDVPVVVNVQ